LKREVKLNTACSKQRTTAIEKDKLDSQFRKINTIKLIGDNSNEIKIK